MGSEGFVHLTIATSESNRGDIGVSATTEGVDEGTCCFCGVGSSSTMRTVGFGPGPVRRFLEWSGNGVEGSSPSERIMGSIVMTMSAPPLCYSAGFRLRNKRGIIHRLIILILLL